jgi:protein involved in polysaccharide export with SLBB domain
VRDAAPPPHDLPRELDKHPTPPYVVEPGDVLLIQPADLASPVQFPGDQPVLPDGSIYLGRYGRLAVAGRTIEEIEAMVRAVIEAKAGEPVPVSVNLTTRASKVYYVLGEVSSPGAFPLAGRETVLDGLLAAGGLTDKASRSCIVLTRPTKPEEPRVVLPVRYLRIVQLGDTTTNYQLAPGDRVYVAPQTLWEALCRGKQAD